MPYFTLDMDPINVVTNGIAENQTTAGAADLVLNGSLADLGGGVFDIYDALYSSGVGGVRIAIDSAGDISSVIFTVTGTDQDGIARTEACGDAAGVDFRARRLADNQDAGRRADSHHRSWPKRQMIPANLTGADPPEKSLQGFPYLCHNFSIPYLIKSEMTDFTDFEAP